MSEPSYYTETADSLVELQQEVLFQHPLRLFKPDEVTSLLTEIDAHNDSHTAS
jgi:hypothetical protein